MKASAFEFRFRYVLHALVFGLGLFAPWNHLLHLDATGANAHTWGVLAALISQQTVIGIGVAFDALLLLGIFFAVLAAALRTWGTAYLGAGVVESGDLQARIVADGPFRSLRNPLYVGTMVHTLALALLMPPSGAVFTLLVIALLQVRLILAEEAFLTRTLGAAYEAYCRLVPRALPSLRPRVKATGQQPHWGQALLAEIYLWGVAGSFAFAGWQFNASLLVRCVLVSMGVALIVRAVQPTRSPRVASV